MTPIAHSLPHVLIEFLMFQTGFSDTNAQALEYIHKIIATKPIDEWVVYCLICDVVRLIFRSINIVGKMKKKAKYRWIPGLCFDSGVAGSVVNYQL